MYLRALQWLACPWCKEPVDVFFGLRTGSGQEEEIHEGGLVCQGCREQFPVIGGVPRFLPDALRGVLVTRYADFFHRFDDSFLGHRSGSDRTSSRRRTLGSFGFEWNHFSEMRSEWRELFLNYIHPLDATFFPGKLGLDAGCGMGKFAYWAASFGAEMIALDLSWAVDAAQRNTAGLKGVHVIQADICHAPMRREVFDFAYSFGVLHHLPEPEVGFRSLLPLLRSGGHVLIYVYKSFKDENKLKYYVLRSIAALRKLTVRVPHRFLYALCLVLAPAVYLFTVPPYHLLRCTPGGVKWMGRLPFQQVPQTKLRDIHLHLFDRLSPPIEHRYVRSEVLAWFRDADFRKVELREYGGWQVRGVKK